MPAVCEEISVPDTWKGRPVARILVVDDESEWLELCTAHLVGMGYEVTAVEDGKSAAHVLRTEKPDLVILDLRMPLSGRSLLRVSRQLCPGIPVVMHSVYAGYRDDPAFSLADAFVVKSTDMRELSSAVGTLLARSGLDQ